jgi:NADH-quinone oxidoreductase subunit E
MMENMDFNTETKIDIREINRIIDQHIRHAGALITILQSVQEKYSYLPRAALEQVSKRLQVPTSRVFHVATFYKAFSLNPKGKHLSTVCLGTACHVRGAKKIASEFERQLNIKAGETTEDKEFTLETVNCVGACALGPVVVVDEKYFPHSTKENVKEIIAKYRGGLDKEDFKSDKRIFPVEVCCPFCNHSLMDQSHPVDGMASIRVMISFGSKQGWLRLSSYFGSYNVQSQQKVPMRTVVKFSCPHCRKELIGTSSCVECDAPMVPMMVRGGGSLQVCSRRGCKGHMLDLSYIKYP